MGSRQKEKEKEKEPSCCEKFCACIEGFFTGYNETNEKLEQFEEDAKKDLFDDIIEKTK